MYNYGGLAFYGRKQRNNTVTNFLNYLRKIKNPAFMKLTLTGSDND